MNTRVINDPSALGWEYDPDTGRWTWGGNSSSGGGGSFPEAPVDGEQYARQNAGWAVVEHPEGGTGGGTVTTADVQLTNPTTFIPGGMATQEDANSYISEELEKIIPDANADGTIYGRQNNGWVAVPAGGGGGDGNVDLSAYYTKAESDARYQAKGNYLVSSDLNGYATQAWVGQQGYLTSASLNGYATQSWVGQNYQPKGTYLTKESDPTVPSYVKSITQADINKWNNPPSGGGDDPNAVKLTGNQTVLGVKKFLGGSTYFQNLFIEGVPAGGVGFAGQSRIEFSSGATTLYGASNTLQVNSAGTSITGGIVCTGTVMALDNVGGTSFTSTVSGSELVTLYGNAIANSGSLGAGLYFSNSAATPTITPCRGSDFAQVDNTISLGNPNKRFQKVWSVEGVGAFKRHTQNENEAVLSVNDLIDVLASLREATKEEKTVDGLRDSIGNCVGGIIEKLEAIQAETEEQLAKEIEMYEQEPEPEPLPPLNIPEQPDFKSITNGEI